MKDNNKLLPIMLVLISVLVIMVLALYGQLISIRNREEEIIENSIEMLPDEDVILYSSKEEAEKILPKGTKYVKLRLSNGESHIVRADEWPIVKVSYPDAEILETY